MDIKRLLIILLIFSLPFMSSFPTEGNEVEEHF